MAAIRRSFFLCRNVRFTNVRFTSSDQKFPMEINENFGSLAETDLLPRPKFKTEKDLEDYDGEAEHFAIISNVKRPYPIDYQRKIEDFLVNRDLAGMYYVCIKLKIWLKLEEKNVKFSIVRGSENLNKFRLIKLVK